MELNKIFNKELTGIWKIKYYPNKRLQIFMENKSVIWIDNPTQEQIDHYRKHSRFKTIKAFK